MSENPNATAGPSSGAAASQSQNGSDAGYDVVKALGNILKTQTGEPISNERISQLLLTNMATLVQQGKLTQRQIIQVRIRMHGL